MFLSFYAYSKIIRIIVTVVLAGPCMPHISVCVHLVGDGVLWSRLCDRLGEEDQGELSEGGLDSLHLPRGAQGKVEKKNTHMHSAQHTYSLYNCSILV